ncbi:MAG: tetratricopeptide repeat protein [Gammaproteobacteria bacterium]
MRSFASIVQFSCVAMLLGLCSPSQADMSTVVQEAQLLIRNAQPAVALQRLQPLVQQHAGDPAFDYTFALALMDSGDNGQAELVFERLLFNSPNFHGARLDYARVLVARGQYAAAGTQLDKLTDSRPPQKALAQIAELRSVIQRRNSVSRWSRYLEASTAAGYDSNVNSATVVDEFLGFALDSSSREQDSDFLDYSVAAGAGYRLAAGMQLSARLNYSKRENAQASFVDSDALFVDLRLVRATETDYQQLSLTGYQFDIDGSRNSEGASLSGTWLRKITPLWRIGITGDAGRISFSENLAVKDVDRFRAGLIGVYSLGDDAQGQVLLRAGFGTDEPRQTDSRYARDFTYAGASLSWRFNSGVRTFLNADFQNSQFEEVFFEQAYTDKREDDRYRLAGLVEWNFRPDWVLSHSLTYTRNDTFVDIFEFERFEALVRLRYTFQ